MEGSRGKKFKYDIQASHRALELVGGWDKLAEMCEHLEDSWPLDAFYPLAYFDKTGNRPADAPDKMYVSYLELDKLKGQAIEVIGYIDEDGIRVFSFDPGRKLHQIADGQHRLRGRL